MAGLPVVLPIPQETATASYSFIDFASGTGIVTFYLGSTVDLRRLSNSVFYSDYINEISSDTTSTSFVKVLDVDYDVEFNRPTTIKGKTVCNIPSGRYYENNSGDNVHYIVVKIRKWDGTTETDLAENTGSEHNPNGYAGTGYHMNSLDLDIPLTVFKKGETLRVTVEGWAKAASSKRVEMCIGADPQNRVKTSGQYLQKWTTPSPDEDITWDSLPTIASIQIPMRIDI